MPKSKATGSTPPVSTSKKRKKAEQSVAPKLEQTKFTGFPRDTFDFLIELAENNNREWFADNRTRYEQSLLEPALQLISSLQKPLAKIAPMLRVEPKRMGGSLMRIYKDTRFSNDKTPYKTNLGIQFRHEMGKDVHAPGIYLHVQPGECFLGAGTWRPPSDALKKIRTFIADNPQAWNRLLNNKKFVERYEMYEDRLKSTPRGYDKQHPLIDQLRQQSFIGMSKLSRAEIEHKDITENLAQRIAAGNAMMSTLCQALELPW